MLNFQGAVHQDSVLLTHAPPLGWVSFPRKTWVSFNYKSIQAADLKLPERDSEPFGTIKIGAVDHPS